VASARRAELTAGALGYVLAEGLVGLSLRPLAAALGTSDRMLLYHFGSKDALVGDVLALASEQLAGTLDPAEPLHRPGDLVRYAWRALTAPGRAGSMRLYLELCVLSLREPGRWTAAHERLREPWLDLLRAALTELDVPAAEAPTLADLVLDTVDGLLLDRMVSADPARADAAALAFAALLDTPHPVAGEPLPGPQVS
jgi:AcrR family transcriptional regulator